MIAFAADVSLLTLVFPVAMLLYALPSQEPHPRFWHVRLSYEAATWHCSVEYPAKRT